MRTCPKCAYVRRPEDAAPDYECPRCGVVYAKYLAQQAGEPPPTIAAAPELTRPAPPSPLRPPPVSAETLERFVGRMRAESLYPTFRQLVGLLYIVWLVLAVLALALGVAGMIWGSGATRFGALMTGLLTALLFWIVARVTREMALMLADLSDAAVRIASKTK